MAMRRFLVLLGLGVAGLLVLLVWFFPTTADFHPQNPFWNGLRRFQRDYQVTAVASFTELPQDAQGTVVVVIPYLEPDGAEMAELRAYVRRGGVLVLANDWGPGNAVLSALDVRARFTGSLLLDPLVHERDQWLPAVRRLMPSPLTEEVTRLTLNSATTLEGDGLRIVAYSSPFSYLDLNRNQAYDTAEPVGPFPVAASTRSGAGTVVLLSDPSVLINGMLGIASNARFVANIVALGGPSPRVYLDQAHLRPSRFERAKVLLASARESASSPGPLMATIAALAVILLAPLWRQKGAPLWTERN